MCFNYESGETRRKPLNKDARHPEGYRFLSWRQEHQ